MSAFKKNDASETEAASVVEVRGTIAYPSLVEPDERSGKFNCLLLIEKGSASEEAINDLVDAAAKDEFGDKGIPAGGFNPIRDSNEKKPDGEFAFKHPAFRDDCIVVRLKTGFDPVCVWGPNETPCDAEEIHGGDDVIIEVSAYAYNNQSAGVGLSLGRIWRLRAGEQRIERGSGSANVKRLDRSGLKFDTDTAAA